MNLLRFLLNMRPKRERKPALLAFYLAAFNRVGVK